MSWTHAELHDSVIDSTARDGTTLMLRGELVWTRASERDTGLAPGELVLLDAVVEELPQSLTSDDDEFLVDLASIQIDDEAPSSVIPLGLARRGRVRVELLSNFGERLACTAAGIQLVMDDERRT